MACDHLDKKTFSNAMEVINKEYCDLYNEFNKEFENAINAYYEAWQSTKGWNKVSELHQWFSRSLSIASEAIVKNYNIMKENGEAYAKMQDMWVFLDNIDKKDFTVVKKQSFDEDREIIVDRDKISEAGQQLETSLKKIVSHIENSLSQTETDQKFGYYSTGGGNNPRDTIYRAYSSLLTSLKNAINQFQLRFAEMLEEDKNEAERIKTEAAVQNSDFSDIF